MILEDFMDRFEYTVERIDGDYAYLVRTDRPQDEPKMVARALLPEEITEGCLVVYECFEYSMG